MTTLSLVFPCYDEAARLPVALEPHLAHLPRDRRQVEVLIVDDGSTDATLAVADAIAARDPRVRVLRSHPNHGKGFAVRVGMLAARGELVVFTDADGAYGPEEIDRVVAALAAAPVAIGVRADADAQGGPLLRRLASRVFNRAMRVAIGLPYRDTQCGLKGLRRDAAREVFGRARCNGFAFDAELLLLAHRLGLEVVEVNVRARDRGGSKVRLAADAARMLRDVWSMRRAAAAGAYDRPWAAEPRAHHSDAAVIRRERDPTSDPS